MRVSVHGMVSSVEFGFVTLAAFENSESARSALIRGESAGGSRILDRLHAPLSRQRVRTWRPLPYSGETGLSRYGLRFHRVRKFFRHRSIILRNRFDALERSLSILLHRELDRTSIQNSHRKCVVGMPGHLVIGSVGFHVNLRDAAIAVVPAFVEQVVFGRTGELECIHLHFPSAIEAALGKQR